MKSIRRRTYDDEVGGLVDRVEVAVAKQCFTSLLKFEI